MSPLTRALVILACASSAAVAAAGPGSAISWPAEADRERLERAHATFAAAAAEARAFIADRERYPPPIGLFLVGRDAQVGHAEMELRASAAVAAHNLFVRDLCKVLKLKTETVGAKQPTLKAVERAGNRAEVYGVLLPHAGDFAKLLARAAAGAGAAATALDQALAELGHGASEAAAAAAAKTGGFDAVLARFAFDAALRASVERDGAGHDENELSGLRQINAYRAALDLRPLVADRALHTMARQFAEEQAELGFFAHEHPADATRRLPADRARAAGYQGRVGENCATGASAREAAWAWRSDAGHHALLVGSEWRAAGFGCASGSVLNTGSTCVPALAPLFEAFPAQRKQ